MCVQSNDSLYDPLDVSTSSYPSLPAVIANTANKGRMTKPGEIVENLGKNCNIAIAKKKMFAIRRNCSSKLRGRKVKIVYLEVTF